MIQSTMNTLKPSAEELLFIVRSFVTVLLFYISFLFTKWLIKALNLLAGMFQPFNHERVSVLMNVFNKASMTRIISSFAMLTDIALDSSNLSIRT